MKKTIYLHIGIGKTGTSAIQKTLFENRESLLNNDIYIPLVGLANNNIGHHELAPFEDDVPNTNTIDLYNKLLREIELTSQSKILISSENFCYCKLNFIEFVQQKFNQFNVKIILFLREQVKLVESTYLLWQTQAYDYKYNIRDFFNMASGGFNYIWIIDKFSNNFGENNIITKVYDKDLMTNGIIEYIFKDIADHIYIRAQTEDVNKSLLVCYSELLSFLDKNFPYLLDSTSNNFVVRKRIVQNLISISYREVKQKNIDQIFKEIYELIDDSFTDSFTAQKEKLAIYINNFKNNLDFDGHLIDHELRKEILIYYRESNFKIADRFLNEESRKYFLKNYST